ncbi:MAG: CRTAC1 family protein [Bacteroidia bacterium]|nr:CRTAC1 family protein [Bacteroidia bacterium]NNM22962.1 CRTAC1 family protein [Flavobacteriaceae bacterium]
MRHRLKILAFLLVGFVLKCPAFAQQNDAISEIINKIHELEREKDPKCYATANRLEDFMYGTPLEEDARNLKIEIQKGIIYLLKNKGSEISRKKGADKINEEHILAVLEELTDFSRSKYGDYRYHLTTGDVLIKQKDFRQYSSVSYGYRSLLSVEQDLLFLSKSELLSFDSKALQMVNDYVNLLTLVTLKIADINARKANERSITKNRLQKTWVLILNESKTRYTLPELDSPITTISEQKEVNVLVRRIIAQKIAAYNKYNNLTESLFLRNIQVYFAKQKWPTDSAISAELRNYYLESLIQFSSALYQQANTIALQQESPLIRVTHVQAALHSFLPAQTNSFEDVIFFPNSHSSRITLESYDLDAFRDSGFHWRILGYTLDDLKEESIRGLDPNASEQLVEGIAQLGVLVLRLAGEISHQQQKPRLDLEDLTAGFVKIQELINTYDFNAESIQISTISSSLESGALSTGFEIVNEKVGVNFQHKSADWLNRLIRSYSTSRSEGVVKLAIPPAFGGSGVACEDINNDGLLDVLLLGGFGNKLYLNRSKGEFQDITVTSGINSWNDSLNSYGEVRQPIIADFNNDGLQDIFITYVNAPHKMHQNIGGGNFTDVSPRTNLGGEHLVGGPATAFDYDNDGLLDLFIGYFGNYIEGTLPTLKRDNNNGLPNKLFRNKGDFVFEEVPFTKDLESNKGWTQAVGHADINQDGLQDIIVGNDFGKNKYYLNTSSGLFNEMSEELGTDKPSYTMNVGITDLNGDLYPDFYISNIVVMQKDEKYVSPNEDTAMKFDREKMANIRTVEANDLFLSTVNANGITGYQLSNNVGRGYSATGWSWDADFFDFDNDGDEDLYCLNGMNDFSVYSSENPFYFERQLESANIEYAKSNREKNVFFVNEGGQLINKAEELGADLNSNARSASYFDFDEDGDLDIVINNYHEEATILENKSDGENQWVKIKLIGHPDAKVNLDAIGSTLLVRLKNGKKIWREIHSTTGYLSVHPKEQHFGLGTDETVDVEIRWSNGKNFLIYNLAANTTYIITYPDKLKLKN